jgi:hypothetical protein
VTLAADEIESLEFERKYLVRPSQAAAATACLRAYCREDERYPEGIVRSVYFDTPGLRLLQEKANSDLYKTKVRLRWYEHPETGETGDISFLEVKRRVGLRRLKWRRRLDLSGRELSRMELTDARLQAVVETIDLDPSVAIAGLRPVLVVSYLRRRWQDPITGARVCLDRAITVPRVNRRLIAGPTTGALSAVVLEIKNPSGLVPLNLGFLAPLGAQQASFSKYAECYHTVTNANRAA